MASMIPMAVGIGQQDAQNPNISFGGSTEHSLFSTLDPIGNEITKYGGDPLNLYGNKNNPNALIFPSSNPNAAAGGTPSVLPTLPGIGAPKTYDPNSFGGYASLGSGSYNKLAAQMAGKVYQPTLMPGSNSGNGSIGSSSGKGLVPVNMVAAGGQPRGGASNGGSGSVGSPFLSLAWAPGTWTSGPIPSGGGLTDSTVFQSMTPGGKAQR